MSNFVEIITFSTQRYYNLRGESDTVLSGPDEYRVKGHNKPHERGDFKFLLIFRQLQLFSRNVKKTTKKCPPKDFIRHFSYVAEGLLPNYM